MAGAATEGAGNDKKNIRPRFISFAHRAFTAWPPGRVVFVLSEILPVSMARNSSKQRPAKRLTTTARPFINSCRVSFITVAIRCANCAAA